MRANFKKEEITDPSSSLSVTAIRILKTLKKYEDNDYNKNSSKFINKDWMATRTYLQYESETTHGMVTDAINFLLKHKLIKEDKQKTWYSEFKKVYKLTELGIKIANIVEKQEEILPWIKKTRNP